MSILFTVSEAKKIGSHVWCASITPADVKRLGQPLQRFGSKSVIGVVDPTFNESTSTLSIYPEMARVLNIGGTNDALIIDIGTEISEQHLPVLMNMNVKELSQNKRGDREFLDECRRILKEPLPNMVERILNEVRREFPGTLNEGKHRKWVNYPENFLAITLQNRDQSFAVYVKGAPESFQTPSLDIKQDRPGYSRFKLRDPRQLEDAIQTILSSARRSVK